MIDHGLIKESLSIVGILIGDLVIIAALYRLVISVVERKGGEDHER
ncbi:hypothetical protein [Tuberibacillus sp. Marseille-P3662]|nr:hypothetical protein [Tuberibacillus sp. Marseille-P3662]